jgi:hypothetical protein
VLQRLSELIGIVFWFCLDTGIFGFAVRSFQRDEIVATVRKNGTAKLKVFKAGFIPPPSRGFRAIIKLFHVLVAQNNF